MTLNPFAQALLKTNKPKEIMKKRAIYLKHLFNEMNIDKEKNNWILKSIWSRLTKEEKEGLPEPELS